MFVSTTLLNFEKVFLRVASYLPITHITTYNHCQNKTREHCKILQFIPEPLFLILQMPLSSSNPYRICNQLID